VNIRKESLKIHELNKNAKKLEKEQSKSPKSRKEIIKIISEIHKWWGGEGGRRWHKQCIHM
jgi:hypothetical protein